MNNTRVFRFLSIALLAAIALYFAAQGYFALTDPFTTTLVYQSSAEDTIDVSGWLVRDEEVLSGESGTVRHEVSEGERVGKGQTVATVYSGSDALDTVQQIEAKELQLQQLQFALSSYLNPDATLKLDGSITESLLSIRRSLSGGDYDDAAGQKAQLKAAPQRAEGRHPQAQPHLLLRRGDRGGHRHGAGRAVRSAKLPLRGPDGDGGALRHLFRRLRRL